MMSGALVLTVAIGYLGLLFAIAWLGDRRAATGHSPIAHPLVYALSIAVYCTSWTFYGSVGRAAASGLAFLPIYLGPTLMMALAGVIVAKMVHIGRSHRITSIADFISARYGKSPLLAGLVTVIAVLGVLPYISLQLQAVSASATALLAPPHAATASIAAAPVLGDMVLLVALLMAAFAILFGTRSIDAAEQHQGMVLAVAFESGVKLIAFLAAGMFVTFGLYDGFGDIFAKAAANPELRRLFTLSGDSQGDWVAMTVASMLAFLCLPRQFQVTVVENVDRRHVNTAVWLFPLYLLVINIFVLPVALAGRMIFAHTDLSPDLYVLALPLSHGAPILAVLVFIGGLSAAASMIIVETVALSTMVSNDLIMPLLLRWRRLKLERRQDLSRLLLGIRRATIVIVVLLGYAYVRLTGESYALATIGMVSFCAAAQFAPALIGGILWKGATAKGALAGLSVGFALWAYTLFLPSLAHSGWLPTAFAQPELLGLEWLKPYALFGLEGLQPGTHALVWSLLFNIGAFILGSLLSGHNAVEHLQATLFVDALKPPGPHGRPHIWRGTASITEVKALCVRFVGIARVEHAIADWAQRRGIDLDHVDEADPDLIEMAETLLAGAIGHASARVVMASVTKGEVVGLDEVLEILDEASQVIAYSQRLEKTSAALKAANVRLTELDRLKDDFIATVTHELRTPLTSIRSFSEILLDSPAMAESQRQEFLAIIIKESDRLTRLINQMLDLARMESGRMCWTIADTAPQPLLQDCVAATLSLFEDKRVTLETRLEQVAPIATDADKVMQVVINLLSNAVKFTPPGTGLVRLGLEPDGDGIRVTVSDNGPGIPPWATDLVFEKFRQVGDTLTNKPQGTGLGLAISKSIIEHLGGRIWLDASTDSPLAGGATFVFTLPARAPDPLD